MTEFIDDVLGVIDDMIDSFFIQPYRSIRRRLRNRGKAVSFRLHKRPALGFIIDLTTKKYYLFEISLLFMSLRIELWNWGTLDLVTTER
ncbi:hypothetical protein LCGC14_2614210 [marine sediment metagenome]|uniref:Uncharacterized protein n=1 Tax=marine sediment metagenome TaxID=412755 RepID=A0A0F9ASM8_9ZZZZ